jgi:hypothetical protein
VAFLNNAVRVLLASGSSAVAENEETGS